MSMRIEPKTAFDLIIIITIITQFQKWKVDFHFHG